MGNSNRVTGASVNRGGLVVQLFFKRLLCTQIIWQIMMNCYIFFLFLFLLEPAGDDRRSIVCQQATSHRSRAGDCETKTAAARAGHGSS